MTIPLPLISVVIPTTDRVHGLKRCIQSVLEQHYPNIEIVVVGNNYKEYTAVPDCLSVFECNRLKYFYLEDCKNANVARNFGAENSSGEFIAFLDSDDFFMPSHIENAHSIWRHTANQKVCIFSNFFVNEPTQACEAYKGSYMQDLRRSLFVSKDLDFRSSTIFVKKEYFLQVKFDELQFKHQDWAFGLAYEEKFGLLYSEQSTVVIVESTENRMSSSTKPKASIRFLLTYLKEPYSSKFLASRLVDEVKLGSYAGVLDYKNTVGASLASALSHMPYAKHFFLRLAISSKFIFLLFKLMLSLYGRFK